jgi:hypothetical protein
VQIFKKNYKEFGTFVWDPNFNIVSYYAFKKFVEGNKVVLNYSYRIDLLQYI